MLAELLPSLRAQQGQTLVIKYGGNAMTEPALQLAFAQDVVLLQRGLGHGVAAVLDDQRLALLRTQTGQELGQHGGALGWG